MTVLIGEYITNTQLDQFDAGGNMYRKTQFSKIRILFSSKCKDCSSQFILAYR